MKVGIMSMQRVCNNGSFLQALGLKQIIESLGHEVVFVDYKVGMPIMKNNTDKKRYVFLCLRNTMIHFFEKFGILSNLLPKEYKMVVYEHKSYKGLIKEYLGADKMRYHTSVDAIVIGSDEVFNCTQINPEVGFSPELFGAHANAKMILSYAASFGNTTIKKLQDFGKVTELKSYFTKFSNISVRDRNSSDVIEKLTGVKPEINLDPVLMYDFMPSIKDEEIRKDYIIVYAYRARITPEEAFEIKKIARRTGKKLISVSGHMDFCDEHILANPFECLNLYRHADYIITDTFHGTILVHPTFRVIWQSCRANNLNLKYLSSRNP